MDRNKVFLWLLLLAILLLSFCIRFVGIGRKESVDNHPDEWVLAQPVYTIANQGQVGIKTHYKWSGCGVIYPVGYTLYWLKPVSGDYSYETILRILRGLSAVASVGAVFMVFLFLYHYHSIRAAYIGAVLLAVSPLPAIVGHYATLDSITLLIGMAVLYGSYRFFHLPDEPAKISVTKTFLLGLLIGWGIAVKWTLLLSAIPFFVAFMGALIAAFRTKKINLFFKQFILKSVVLLVGLVLGFLVFFPDVQLVPNKVKDGLDYEMKHLKTGHYGNVLSNAGQLNKRIKRTYDHLSGCGWKIIGISGLCSVGFVFFKRNALKWYLFFVFLLWTYVPFKNLVSAPRHHLLAYLALLLLLSVFIDFLLSHRNIYVKATVAVLFSAGVLITLLYTCVCISPFWQEDPRVTCANWIIENVPAGSGVTWAPRHQPYNWAVPGTRIAPYLFQKFPRQAQPGKRAIPSRFTQRKWNLSKTPAHPENRSIRMVPHATSDAAGNSALL